MRLKNKKRGYNMRQAAASTRLPRFSLQTFAFSFSPPPPPLPWRIRRDKAAEVAQAHKRAFLRDPDDDD